MAKDVITRFKLETTQFDSKIKNTAKELSDIGKSASAAGKDFGKLTKDSIDAARSFGSMATSMTDAKGKAKELVSAFNDLAKTYNALNKEQQQSDFGKAVSASLTQLQQRIKETKQEMQNLSSSSGGLFGGDKLDGMLQVFGGNLMTKGASLLTGLASEMGEMVAQGVELAKQGEGIRIAFERLGRGDILDGLREATHGTVTDLELMKAAVKFNDFNLPVEELGTMLAFAQQKAKDTGQSVDYMVDSIVTGLGRKSLMILDNLGLSATEVKEKMKETGDMTKAVGQIIRQQMAAAGDYVETAADRAAQANVSLQNKMEELGRKFAPVEEASNQLWTSMKIGIMDIIGGPLARLLNGLTEAGRLKNAINNMNGGGNGGPTRIDRMISMLGNGQNQRSRNTYNKQVATFDERINQQQFRIASLRGNDAITRGLRQKAETELKALEAMRAEYISRANDVFNPKSTTPLKLTTDQKKNKEKELTEQTELQKNQTKINALTQEYVKLGDESTEAARERQAEIQREIELLKQRNGLLGLRAEQAQGRMLVGAGDIQRDGLSNTPGTLLTAPSTDIPTGGLQLSDKAMGAVNKNIQKQMKGVESIADKWQDVGSAISAVGSAMTSIEDPAVKVLGIVAQAIATVALTFAKSLSGTVTPWDWIAAAAAGTATMISTISAIHSATGYAEGGMIKGNSYSGDNLMAQGPDGLIGLNAGEIVLNKSQQATLAQNLQGGGLQGLNLTATIRGEQIRLALNNNGRRTGRGEYVQSKNVK